jgi:hypothetical protein
MGVGRIAAGCRDMIGIIDLYQYVQAETPTSNDLVSEDQAKAFNR